MVYTRSIWHIQHIQVIYTIYAAYIVGVQYIQSIRCIYSIYAVYTAHAGTGRCVIAHVRRLLCQRMRLTPHHCDHCDDCMMHTPGPVIQSSLAPRTKARSLPAISQSASDTLQVVLAFRRPRTLSELVSPVSTLVEYFQFGKFVLFKVMSE
jgi:hypothetical protein